MPDTRDATAERKDSHIRICLDEQVEFVSLGSRGDGNGFGSYRFDHDALPEVSKSEVSLATTVLGKRLKAPLFIAPMNSGALSRLPSTVVARLTSLLLTSGSASWSNRYEPKPLPSPRLPKDTNSTCSSRQMRMWLSFLSAVASRVSGISR